MTLNRAQYTTSGLTFTYEPLAGVVAVSPASGPVAGGTLVVVVGTGFINSGLLKCRFGGPSGTPVAAVWLSATALQCTSPATGTEGVQSVEVTNNMMDFTSNSVHFTYEKQPSISSISVAAGPTGGGWVATTLPF